MSKRPYHHGNLREALVEAAMLEVLERGVAGLTLRGVARRAGVSQAAPYHHFANKEALIAELCLRGFRALNDRLRVARATTDEPVAQLRAMGEAYIAFAREQPARFRVLFGHYVEDKAEYEELLHEAESSFEILVSSIARGQALGAFRGDDPVTTSLGLWSGVHGAAMMLVDGAIEYDSLRKRGVDADRLVGATIEQCLRGIQP